ncbi:carboxypeptidase-like regulatory domain-containing protein [Agrobacterium tumefaciens]|nr:carboxypeptidase-like regulatory domain-containing protein [Agrobacterium tumefaciens]NTE24936.1 carboxypeptidase-like regulatory domain-containing protein [Agrobacterium tumefaciens]
MRLFFKLTLLALLLGFCAQAQQQLTLSGKITDSKGNPVPFVTIYVNTTTKGTSSNIEGNYSLNLPAGKIDLLFTAIGFETRLVNTNLFDNKTLNITLISKIFTLKDVVIGRNTEAEDTADDIIKKAIKKREIYLDEVKAFTCDVYTKGMQKLLSSPKKFFGRDVAKILDLNDKGEGIIYLSETVSKLDFQKENKIKEVMVSSKIAGNDNGFSFNKASDLTINFYKNVVLEDKLNVRGFISPISDQAFSYYRFKLLGTNQDADGQTISKIEVKPKRVNDPVFTGEIYIINGSWRLNAVNLFLTKKSGIEFIDTLNIKQQMVLIDKIAVPSSVQFDLKGKVLGFKFAGYAVGVYKNYNVQPAFNKHFFSNEILKINPSSNKKDSLYWAKSRPVPLTLEENENYIKKDSVSRLKSSKKYLDSVDNVKNKFNLKQILITPYIYYRSYNKKSITYDPIFKSVFYNTIEGVALRYAVSLRQGFDDGRYYSVKPEVRYGFGNKHFNGNIQAKYFYDPIKNGMISVGFGTEVANLNSLKQANLFRNSINALVFGRNISKFYERRYLNIEASREFAPSFDLKITADYAEREALLNSSYLSFGKTNEFTANDPFNPTDNQSLLFPKHTGFILSGTLAYTIAQKYITRPDGRFYIESKYPRLEITYKKGIPNFFNSDVNYDFLSAEIFQKDLHFLLLGKSSLFIGAGKFLNAKQLYYPDWKHFRANRSLIFDADVRNFHFLDFYLFSTTKQYFEAHYQHNFGSFFISKIPLLRRLKIEEIIGGAYLTSPEKRNYSEFYFGFKRLNLRVDYGYAFDSNRRIEQGFKLSYGF